MEFFLVVPAVGRNLVVVIMFVVICVTQAVAGNVSFYQAGLRHAVAGRQDWRWIVKVVWIQYPPAHRYVTSFSIAGNILVRSIVMLVSVLRV